jgi:hypothetical protein
VRSLDVYIALAGILACPDGNSIEQVICRLVCLVMMPGGLFGCVDEDESKGGY